MKLAGGNRVPNPSGLTFIDGNIYRKWLQMMKKKNWRLKSFLTLNPHIIMRQQRTLG